MGGKKINTVKYLCLENKGKLFKGGYYLRKFGILSYFWCIQESFTAKAIAKIISAKNARAWVSMVSYLKK